MNPIGCKVCDKTSRDGINLLGIHICRDCIKSITNTGIGDIRYNYYKSIIKKIWVDYIIENS